MKNLKSQYIGIITGIVMIAASLFAFYYLHLPTKSNFLLIVYSIYSVGIVLTLLRYYKSDIPNKKFKDYFSEGFKAFIVVVLFMVIYTFIFVKTNPSIIASFITENNKLLLAEGNRTEAEISANEDKIKSMFLLSMVMGATIIYLIIGALISVLGAGFLSQKSKQLPNAENA